MFKNNTRADIHSGLSFTKDDHKWSDQLNFRSKGKRTFVIERRRALLLRDGGFHTIVHGLNQDNYVFGSKESYKFYGNDDTEFIRLWRARLHQKIVSDRCVEPPRIRGSYTGSHTTTIKLTVVDNVLVADANWPEEPEPEVETLPEVTIDCGTPSVLPRWTVKVQDCFTLSPQRGATVTFYKGRLVVATGITDSFGNVSVRLAPDTYNVSITAQAHQPLSYSLTLGDLSNQSNTVCVPPDTHYMENYVIKVLYSSTLGPVPGGHQCNAAIYKVLVNGVNIGWANLNNESDGGDREITFVLTEEVAKNIVGMSGISDRLDLAIMCDPTAPGFDLFTYNGACHPNLAWVQVFNANNTKVYDGAPSGFFLTIPLT